MSLENTREKLRAAVDALSGSGSKRAGLRNAGITLTAYLWDEDFPEGPLRGKYREIIRGLTATFDNDRGALPATIERMGSDEVEHWAAAIRALLQTVLDVEHAEQTQPSTRH